MWGEHYYLSFNHHTEKFLPAISMADTKLHEGNTLRHFVFTFSTYKKKNDFIESIGKLVHCGMQKIFSFTSIGRASYCRHSKRAKWKWRVRVTRQRERMCYQDNKFKGRTLRRERQVLVRRQLSLASVSRSRPSNVRHTRSCGKENAFFIRHNPSSVHL